MSRWAKQRRELSATYFAHSAAIRQAVADGMPIDAIAEETGLSLEQITRIANHKRLEYSARA